MISNIAKGDATISAAHPADPWLELDVVEASMKKPGIDSTWNEHVATVDVEVGSGTLSDLTNMFHVVVDGQPYGPFQRVSCNK